jgi:Flp pilus assembly protein TadD
MSNKIIQTAKLTAMAQQALSHNPKTALKFARLAAKKSPTSSMLWYDLGLIAQQNNNLEEAERAFQRAISLTPNFAAAYANLTALSAQRRRLQQTIRFREPPIMLHLEREEQALQDYFGE